MLCPTNHPAAFDLRIGAFFGLWHVFSMSVAPGLALVFALVTITVLAKV